MRTVLLLALIACSGGTKQKSEPKLVPVSEAPPFNEPDSTKPAISDKELAASTTKFLGLVDRSKADIIGCFNLAARRHKQTDGLKLALTATFANTGKPIRIHVMPPLDREFEDCVTAAGRDWRVFVSLETTFKANLDLPAPP